MDQILIEQSQRLDKKEPADSPGELPSELLGQIQSLYEKGLCRQACDLACLVQPLDQWRGADACLLTGRIALALGAPRLGHRQHVRAFRTSPENDRTQAYYLATVLAIRGPVFAWQTFRQFEQNARVTFEREQTDQGWEYLFTLGARICGYLRDFEQAEARLKIAEEYRSDSPWLFVERSTVLTLQEQWEEGLKLSKHALELRPWLRPAVQQTAHCLHTLNRDDEALQLLNEAARRIESVPILAQLAVLQMDLERYAPAMDTWERAEKLSPILDKTHRDWIAAQRCKASCALGKYAQAETFAQQLNDPYHSSLAERLRKEDKKFCRVQLSVPFVQQYRLTCVPATLTMLCHFWNIAAAHVEVAEAICYDGTPSHRARRWAEANGMLASEFTLDWNIAVALLDRQIPFAVYTAEATSGHVRVVIGYDELRRTFILRDPSFPQIVEAPAEQFLKHYEASGPASMVTVPVHEGHLLDGLSFPDEELYDRLRKLQQALEEHRRRDAIAELQELQTKAPDHRLTLTAWRALYTYDTNSPALMECLDKLLALFPQDANLLLARLTILRETGRREERLDYLTEICARKEADPIFHQLLAEELMADARRYPEAQRALKRALRLHPLNAYTITTLANLYWTQHRFNEALDFYRFAGCLEDKKEPPAGIYFAAANARRQTEVALTFLRERWERTGAKSPGPFITWFGALQQIGRSHEALHQLEEVLRSQPKHGEIWLTGADAFARHGNFARADQCLVAAEGRVQRAAFLRVKADLARYRTDSKTALSLWREALQIEPLSMAVHSSLVRVLAECEGREAALKYLQEVCERFPHHYQLHRLWSEWAWGAGPEVAEKVTRELVGIHPADAWARRQLALVLADGARFAEALEEAEEGLRLAPQQAVSHAALAHIKLGLGRTAVAQEDSREAIRLSVDYSPAIYGLVNSFRTLAERRQALAFVEGELVRQVVFGEGLRAYREAARLNLEPEALLGSLRVALRERPDLPTAWSVVVQQLAEMLQLDEALTLAQQTTERFPLQEQAWQDLALVQRLRADTKGEQDAWEQAMRISPASSSSARMLAQFYERLGDIARAKTLLEEACARSPLDAFSHGELAMLLWREGHQSAAIEKMRHALKLHPGYGQGWQMLASWAAATGQSALAEDLARTLVLQRPGEVRSMLVLARLLVTTGRLDEALQTVNESLKNFERNVEAHELRAEILAALGKQPEADAACEPAVWGTRPPATLRACRAKLEAQRGNLISAIARMKDVLQENPGYVAGWQNLAQWSWQRKLCEEGMAAVTNMRRLEPLNPVPLGYRASLKLQKHDHAGARADLELALKYDPAYTFAAFTLFDSQLIDADIDGAKQTLQLVQRYAEADAAKACEVKLRFRLLELGATKKTDASADAEQRRADELDQAFARLKDLCSAKGSETQSLEMAVKAPLDAGQTKRVDQILMEAIKLPDCNPAVGTWWMRRRIARGKWFCTRQVRQACSQSEAARQAVITLIESLGNQKGFTGQTLLGAYLIVTLIKLFERQVRGCALLWLAWRQRGWLRNDDNGWATMGFALVNLNRFRRAIGWMHDWRERSNLKMWMLFNLALALRSRRRWQEAHEVLSCAIKLPERDHTFQKLRLLLTLEQALSGHTAEAAGHFHELDATGWSSYMLIQYHYTRGLLFVQQAGSTEKKSVFRAERAAIREVLAQHRASTFSPDYRRCLTRMAKDAGKRWIVVPVWLRR